MEYPHCAIAIPILLPILMCFPQQFTVNCAIILNFIQIAILQCERSLMLRVTTS